MKDRVLLTGMASFREMSQQGEVTSEIPCTPHGRCLRTETNAWVALVDTCAAAYVVHVWPLDLRVLRRRLPAHPHQVDV